MKKTLCVIATVLLLSTFLFACSESDTPRGMINVREAAVGMADDIASFSLFIPQGWEGAVSRGMVSAYNIASPETTVTAMRGSLGGQVRPRAVWENVMVEMDATFDDFAKIYSRNVEDDDEFRIEGFGAFEVHYRVTVAGNTYYYAQVFVLRGGSKFIITMTAPQLTQDNLADFSLMIQHFSFNSNAETPEGMTRISADTSLIDPTPGFDMYVPLTWFVDVSQGHLFARPNFGTLANLTVVRVPLDDSMDLHQYAMEAMAPIFAHHEMIQPPITENMEEDSAISREQVTLSDESALQYTYTLTINDVESHFIQVLAEHNGYIFIITFTSQEAGLERNVETFEEIMKHFRFVD